MKTLTCPGSQEITTSEIENVVSNLDAEYKGKTGVPAVVKCEFCGKELETSGVYIPFLNRVIWDLQPTPCTCEKGAAAYKERQDRAEAAKAQYELEARNVEIGRKRAACGMNARQRLSTFSSLKKTLANTKMVNVAKRYVSGFNKLLQEGVHAKTGLYICGPVGTGKSYIAAAIANEILNTNQSVIFTTMIQLQNALKQTYRQNGWDELDVMETYKRAKLLILDDLGKEQPSEWNLSRLFEIVDSRNGNFMPMIITSNYNLDQLAERLTPSRSGDQTTARAIVDRLMEACVALELNGKSWRA